MSYDDRSRLHVNQHTTDTVPLPLCSQGEAKVHDFHVEIKKQPNNLLKNEGKVFITTYPQKIPFLVS